MSTKGSTSSSSSASTAPASRNRRSHKTSTGATKRSSPDDDLTQQPGQETLTTPLSKRTKYNTMEGGGDTLSQQSEGLMHPPQSPGLFNMPPGVHPNSGYFSTVNTESLVTQLKQYSDLTARAAHEVAERRRYETQELKKEHEKKVDELKGQHRKTVTEMQTKFDKKIASEVEGRDKKIRELEIELAEKVAALKEAKHASKEHLENLKQQVIEKNAMIVELQGNAKGNEDEIERLRAEKEEATRNYENLLDQVQNVKSIMFQVGPDKSRRASAL